MLILLNERYRSVFRFPINNQMPDMGVGLLQNTFYRPLQRWLGIVGDGDDRLSYHIEVYKTLVSDSFRPLAGNSLMA